MATLTQPRRHKLDVDAYYRMMEAGILASDSSAASVYRSLVLNYSKYSRSATSIQ